LLFALSAIWGASFMFIKVAVREMSPLMLVSLRLALAAATLLLLSRLVARFRPERGQEASLGRMWPAYLFVAVVNSILPYTLIAWGEERITSGAASILNATTPLFTALLAAGLARAGVAGERLTGGRLLGLMLGFAGVGVVIAGSGGDLAFGVDRSALLGQTAVLGAALLYGVSGLYARRAFAGTPPILPATWQNILGAFILLPFALALTPLAGIPSWEAIASVVALGVLGTGVALLLFYELLARVGPTRTVMVTYLLPVTALVYGALFLSESVTLTSLLGLALVLGGIALTARSGGGERPRTRPAPTRS
jgi:drug/metabolite transporter (DMT)-like permease